jgi:SAM-dependent methyltransferase
MIAYSTKTLNENWGYLYSFLSSYSSTTYIIISIAIAAILFFLISQLFKGKPDYHSKDYWDSRYSYYKKRMDWYIEYKQMCTDFKIHEIINNKNSKILELGCGNSDLASDLYDDGYRNVTSIDFSDVVIKKMKEKHYDKNINCKHNM